MIQLKPLLAASRVRVGAPVFISYCGAVAAAAVAAGCAGPSTLNARNAGWTATEVADSYVFGYPLVVMDVLREMQTAATPVNTLSPGGPPYADTATTGAGWLDLAAEPVVVWLPDSHGRYTLLQANDMWTNVAVSVGSRTTGTKAQTIAFVGPGWQGELPPGVARVDSPTRYLMLDMIEPGAPRRMVKTHKAGNTPRVAPLTAWLGKHGAEPAPRIASSAVPAGASDPSAGPGPDDDAASMAAAALAQVDRMDAQTFFTRLSQALADNPATPGADDHALQVLAQLGVVPGKSVRLAAESADVLARGVDEGRARVKTVPPNGVVAANGWRWFGDDVGNYGQDYAYRAYVTSVLPGAGLKEDELTPIAHVDADNQPLSGANRYVVHFARNQLPASAGGWSLVAQPLADPGGATDDKADGTASAAQTQASAVLRARHRALGSRERPAHNRDGSVDILVQAGFPGRAHAANWLATPAGPFRLVMRVYGPKANTADGSWQPPPVVRR